MTGTHRYHITEGTAFTVRTPDGDVEIGPGWIAITEAEYAELNRKADTPALCTVTATADPDGTTHTRVQTHGNSFDDALRALTAIRDELQRQIDARERCPANRNTS
jgi:hypothetical protein